MPTPIPNIWQLQSRNDIDGLIEALRHTEATVRKNAAAALRALGAWQAVPALEAALLVEHDWQAHATISAALQYLDHDLHVETMIKNKDIRGLTKMLTSPRHEDITMACQALATIGDRRAAESLVMVFRSPLLPNAVRLAAAEALLKLESAPAVVTLLGALRRDNWQVRRNAAAVLGQLQATWATQPLIDALDDPNLAVRRTAAAALRRFNTPEAVAAANKFDEAQAKMATQEMSDGEQEGESTPAPQAQAPSGTTAPLSPTPTTPAEPSSATKPLSEPLPTAPAEPVITPTPESKPAETPATSAATEITITPPGQHQAPTAPVAPVITPPPAQDKPAFADLAKGDTGVLRRLREKATGTLSSSTVPQTGTLSGKPKRETQPLTPVPATPTDSAPLAPAPTPPVTPSASANTPADSAPLAPTAPASPATPPPPSVPELPPEKPDSES